MDFEVIKDRFNQHKKFYLGIILFFIVLLPLLLFCKKWHFFVEDFCSVFRASRVQSFKDFINLFIYGDVLHHSHRFIIPGKYINPEFAPYNFLNVLYRPVCLFLEYIQHFFFGLNPYYYYVSSIFLHAVISSLIFYNFSFFVSNSVAFLSGLFFAFSPSWFDWLGKIDTHQHQFGLFFAILFFMVVRKIIIRMRCGVWLWIAGILYLMSLLVRESFVVLPALVILFSIPEFFQLKEKKLNFFWLIFKVIFSLGLFFLLYIWMRQTAYPIDFASLSFSSSGVFREHINKTFTFVLSLPKAAYLSTLTLFTTYKFYFFSLENGFVWLYKILKFFLFFVLFVLFLTNKKKGIILFLITGFLLFLWPIYLFGSGLRFFYEASPLGILAIAMLFDFSSLKKYRFLKLIIGFCFVLIIFLNSIFIIYTCNIRSTRGKNLAEQIKFLPKRVFTNFDGRAIFIFNAYDEMTSQTGMIEAFQLYNVFRDVPKISYKFLSIFPLKANIKELLEVKQVGDKIHFKTIVKEKMWFKLEENFTMNEAVVKNVLINEYSQDNKIFNMTVVLGEYFAQYKMLFLVWDYEQDSFLIY